MYVAYADTSLSLKREKVMLTGKVAGLLIDVRSAVDDDARFSILFFNK
jgi:hypothetical protein